MNVIKRLLCLCFLCSFSVTEAQVYPAYGQETRVTISGLTFDAMEPFISPDGNTLYFNSLNSGGNTNLYSAERVNDSLFAFTGIVNGTLDTSSSHLDGVASVDSSGNFFWVSLRNYPLSMENLHRGELSAGIVSSISRVYGDFNVPVFNYPFGWLIMDAAINYKGDRLYYCNALFDFSNTVCSGLPCEASIGVAAKVNDSTFNKLINTDAIFSYVNDTNYLVYAPQVSYNGLELYFTRLLKGTYNTEICVSVRAQSDEPFSLPSVIYSDFGLFPEAATPTSDGMKIYYHRKDETNFYRIYLRHKNGTTESTTTETAEKLYLYPNPAVTKLHIAQPISGVKPEIEIYNCFGYRLLTELGGAEIDVSTLEDGMYFLTYRINGHINVLKFSKISSR